MKKETRVTHPPEAKLPDGNVPVVTPVYRSVKFTYPTIDASLSREAKEGGFDYTRDSNPTTRGGLPLPVAPSPLTINYRPDCGVAVVARDPGPPGQVSISSNNAQSID